MPATTSVRLTDETKAEIAKLSKHLGIKSTAAIISLAIRRLSQAELPAPKRKAKQ